MGEAKRRKQADIDQERVIWGHKIPKLQDLVSELTDEELHKLYSNQGFLG